MKNKALIGGLIALAILGLIISVCVWVGKKGLDGLSNTEESAVTRPDGRPQQPSVPSGAPSSPEQAQQVFLALGNPSSASTSDPNNYLLVNNYFVLSYNRDKAIPNWAAWRISPAEVGDNPRPEPDPFRPDERLPKGWKRVTPSDYTGSGFDRGHLSPSADRSGSVEAMTATFLMTNMTPQTGDLNRGPWQKLEAYLRTLVTRGNDVYIYAGVYGEKGKVKNKVSIPTNNWKVAVAVPSGSPISAINENARVIAVDMPNVKGILRADWQVYRTTVRRIEQNTGYNLFSNLPQNVQDALETKTDNINN
ncbi:MAG: non-specific endonuclease [Acidobacteria bacterium]|nr:non-specific endonuclease [Acidobacteriota bacterium]